MKLRRTSSSTLRTRQRHADSEESTPARASEYSYSSRRSEEMANVGRGERKKSPMPSQYGVKFWLQRFGLIILLVAVVASAFNILDALEYCPDIARNLR